MIWFSLLIPVIAVVVLLIFFNKKMAWWEYLTVFGIPVILIVVAKFLSVGFQINTQEVWNSYAVKVQYLEEWDEWIEQTCTRCSSHDDDGNCTSYTTYDCSYRKYHPPEWIVHDNIGNRIGVSREFFENVAKMWKMRKFNELNRGFYRIDGDEYFADYPGVFEVEIPVCTKHIYKNKVRCSKSVFNFQEVNKDEIAKYSLFNYPAIVNFGYNPILGWNNQNDGLRLQRYNGLFGAFKRVHMMILVFRDQPVDAGVFQEAYWKGANKNEFVLCIGTSKNRITWTKVISWTDINELKVYVARAVKQMDTLNMPAIVDLMANEVNRKFVKKDFRDFDYISVEPSDKAVVITIILTLLTTMGIAIFSVLNRWNVDGERLYNFGRKYR